MATPATTATAELTENILYMKLLHELKASFPAVPDEVVGQCIQQLGKDKSRCIEYLRQQSDQMTHGGHYRRLVTQPRRFSTALISHQVEQCKKLERELELAKVEVQAVHNDVIDLEKKLNLAQMLSQGKVNAEKIEKEICDLRHSCDNMSAEVTRLTEGKEVPLGETSIDFYEKFQAALNQEATSVTRFSQTSTGGSNINQTRSGPPISGSTNTSGGGLVDEKQWSCTACTFLNHPALTSCEECDMPRIDVAAAADIAGEYNAQKELSLSLSNNNNNS